MPHDHTHHGHVHLDPESGDRRVAIAIWANGLLTIAQIIGGILSGSLALVADALHNLSDMMSLVIAFAARKIARKPADADMSFGYGRIEIVAALINYTTLILVGLYLVYEGMMRLIEPPEVTGWLVVLIGGVALLIDTLTALLTYTMQKDSINIRAMFLHNLSDALASVAVIIGGLLIMFYDIRIVDPIITILIAGYILWLAFAEIGGPIRTLMLGSPDGLDNVEVIDAIRAIDGVESLHHVHLWQMQEQTAALDCHIVINPDDWSRGPQIRNAIKTHLARHFSIKHVTLELETSDETRCTGTLYGDC
ncbi:cation diffusion facilitator family transporter [Lentibacter sp. XHP0401]|uniref:cation diffusion facilitator family transporter n=1 Tax=Lentibacter sp. XHP0401 TaxID=2984334 RepID=UPI0021E95C1A|nr:cation diffusion facilitator family transporter [Lentibacter sp. XHP0401]MCV2892183.1 cation diffusion facilitator family transporter [Lentibacter sp. XHP0401]